MKGKRIIFKKIFATLVLTILILNNCINIFSIFDSSVSAASTDIIIRLEEKNENYINDAQIFNMSSMSMQGNGKYIEVSINASNISFKGIDILLTYDSSKIQPAQIEKSDGTTIATWNNLLASGDITTSNIEYNSTLGFDLDKAEIDTTNSTIRLTTTGGTAYNSSTEETMIMKLAFRLVDESLSTSELTEDILELTPSGASLPNGIKVIYSDGSYKTDVSLVSYENFAKVQKPVSSIEITTPPTKITYTHGDIIDLAGGKIKVTYEDGTSEELAMTADGVTCSPTVANYSSPSVTITYGGKTATQTITVSNTIKKVELNPKPTDTEYYIGEEVSLEGGKILVTYADNTTQSVDIDESWVTIPELNTTGDIPITIRYEQGGQTYTLQYTVTVRDKAISLELDEENMPYSEYYIGGEFKPGGSAVVKFLSGLELPINEITESMVEGFDTTQVATNLPITVKYTDEDGNKVTDTYTINVKNRAVEGEEGLVIIENPVTNYKYGEEFKPGGKIRVTYIDGTTEDVDITEDMLEGFTTSERGTHTVTINYAEGSVTYNITVTDYVVSIEITPPTKTQYKYGDNLDFAGGEIKKYYASNPTTPVVMSISSNMLTPAYNPNQLGSQNLIISYSEDDVSESVEYNITVENWIKDIELVPPTKTVYNYGEALDLTGGTVTPINADDTKGNPVLLTDENVVVTDEDYNPNQIGTQTIQVTYEGITKPLTVEVTDYIESAQITVPTQTQVLYGYNLDLSTGSILVKYKSLPEAITIDITQDMISGFNKNQLGTQTVTITYEIATEEYQVTVVDYITSIEVTPPTKVTYNLGEDLNLTGGQVREVYASGAKGDFVNLTQDMVSGYNANVEGTQNITVSYKDKTTTFAVEVVDNSKTVTGISISKNPNKLAYSNGEKIDITGGKILLTYDDGSTEEVDMTSTNITFLNGDTADEDKLVEGVQNVQIQFRQYTVQPEPLSFNITIKNDITSIRIVQTPKTEYNIGEQLDVTNGMLEVTYEDGTTKQVPITGNMVFGFDSSQATTSQTLTVRYTENGVTLEAQYNISVVDFANTITEVAIYEYPTKMEYVPGEQIDLSGGVIIVTYKNGETEYVDMTSDEITLLTPTADSSTKRVRFTYKNNNYAFDIQVNNPIKSIEVKNTPKTEYAIGEALDLTGGTILVTYSDNTTKEIPMTEDMISGFDSSVEKKNREITVSYTEDGVTKQTNYIVNVTKPILKSNLNIVKYVSVINNQVITANVPRLERVNGQVRYVVNSTNLEVENGDEITFNIRIYNTGDMSEYVESIIEQLPSHLQFVADNETNIRNGWVKSGNNAVKTNVLSKQNDVDGTNIIEAYDAEDVEPPYKELQLVVKVVAEEGKDATGDSTTVLEETINNQGEQTKPEENQTNVVVKVVTFDLKIDKYITKITQLNTYNGDSVVKNVSKTDGVTKIELYRNDVQYTKLLVEYNIDVTNTGSGTATLDKLVDQIPSGLQFAADMNSDWTLSGSQAVNTSLSNKKLSPGETVTAKLVLQWQGENNLGSITNKASLSSANDSLSTNNEDSAILLVSIATAGAVTYMMVAAAVVGVFGSGVYFIKRFVI